MNFLNEEQEFFLKAIAGKMAMDVARVYPMQLAHQVELATALVELARLHLEAGHAYPGPEQAPGYRDYPRVTVAPQAGVAVSVGQGLPLFTAAMDDLNATCYVTPFWASQAFGVPGTTLSAWRRQGKGPKWRRRGYRGVVYLWPALEAWMKKNGYERQANTQAPDLEVQP